MLRSEITTVKVLGAADRAAAMEVIEEVYRREKRWIDNPDAEIHPAIAENAQVSWFLTRVGEAPAGVIRLTYDPPLALPPELDFQLERQIDLDRLPDGLRFVEIGRFMILPRYRRRIRVVLNLMRGAVEEVVDRGYTHFLTDVFESDPHSPLHFHTRVLGFERIGTHRFGELDCQSVRIVLVLDIARAYRRLAQRRDKVYRELAAGLQDRLEAMPLAPAL
jgi:hypothetical protein